MNIFYLDKSPRLAAEYHCDKHVVKMLLESAQILSTAHRMLEGKLEEKRWVLSGIRDSVLYKVTHQNHPSSVWARSSADNYEWLYRLYDTLCHEYKRRYKKIHKSEEISYYLRDAPLWIPLESFTPPPQCMPDEYKRDDCVEAYRAYYRGAKASFAKWKTQQPEWW